MEFVLVYHKEWKCTMDLLRLFCFGLAQHVRKFERVGLPNCKVGQSENFRRVRISSLGKFERCGDKLKQDSR